MSFADPQSFTPTGGTAISLPRTSSGPNSGAFSANDGNTSLLVSHQYGNRIRRVLRLNAQKTAANPLNPSINSLFTFSTYLVVDLPVVGYTVTDQFNLVNGFTTYLAAGSGAKVTQLLGGEN